MASKKDRATETQSAETETASAAPTRTEGPTLLTKMSVATMGCPAKKILGYGDEVRTLPLARILGVATGIKVKEDKNSGYVHIAIVGEFEGINMHTGEVFRAAVLYLPAGIHELLEGPLRANKDASIEFALDIAAVRATNAAGYSYAAKPHVEARENDKMAALRNSMPALPALPKPQ